MSRKCGPVTREDMAQIKEVVASHPDTPFMVALAAAQNAADIRWNDKTFK